MSILTTNNIQTIDRMGVGRCTEFCALYWRSFKCSGLYCETVITKKSLPVVPNHNLTAICSTNQKVGMISKRYLSNVSRQVFNSLCKFGFRYSRLTLKYVFWCFLGEFSIPNKSNSVRVNIGCTILAI